MYAATNTSLYWINYAMYFLFKIWLYYTNAHIGILYVSAIQMLFLVLVLIEMSSYLRHVFAR